MYTAALSQWPMHGNNQSVLLIDDWIKMMWYIYQYIMECYSAIRKDEILPFVTTWMDLENIMLSKKKKKKRIGIICGSH